MARLRAGVTPKSRRDRQTGKERSLYHPRRLGQWRIDSKAPKRHNACICGLGNAVFLTATTAVRVSCAENRGSKSTPKHGAVPAASTERPNEVGHRKCFAGKGFWRNCTVPGRSLRRIERATAPASVKRFQRE